ALLPTAFLVLDELVVDIGVLRPPDLERPLGPQLVEPVLDRRFGLLLAIRTQRLAADRVHDALGRRLLDLDRDALAAALLRRRAELDRGAPRAREQLAILDRVLDRLRSIAAAAAALRPAEATRQFAADRAADEAADHVLGLVAGLVGRGFLAELGP